jgi:hypothetical protein
MKSWSRIGLAGAIAIAAGATPALADVIFSDNTFNLGNYAASPTFVTDGSASIVYNQCASCGMPGNGLEFTATFTASDTPKSAAVGLTNTTFSYNPQTQGEVASIDASVDKNITVDIPGAGFGNTFRPLILQDGVYYVATVPGPTFNGPGGPGYLAFATVLSETSFVSYDFTTNTFGLANPDFGGNPFALGVAQISGIGAGSPLPAHVVTQYDNLVYTLHIPEPGTAGVFIAALVGLGWFGSRRR